MVFDPGIEYAVACSIIMIVAGVIITVSEHVISVLEQPVAFACHHFPVHAARIVQQVNYIRGCGIY